MKSAVSTPQAATGRQISLSELGRGAVAQVVTLVDSTPLDSGRDAGQSLLTRLRDLGFVPGAHCEVIARMWLGGDPLVVRIGGSTFALRRAEAAAVRVQPASCDARAILGREGTAALPA